MTATVEVVEAAIGRHYHECRHAHPDNEAWFACEARAVVAALGQDTDHEAQEGTHDARA